MCPIAATVLSLWSFEKAARSSHWTLQKHSELCASLEMREGRSRHLGEYRRLPIPSSLLRARLTFLVIEANLDCAGTVLQEMNNLNWLYPGSSANTAYRYASVPITSLHQIVRASHVRNHCLCQLQLYIAFHLTTGLTTCLCVAGSKFDPVFIISALSGRQMNQESKIEWRYFVAGWNTSTNDIFMRQYK